MNEILYNSYNQKLNLNINNNQGIYKTDSNAVTSKTSNKKSTSSDSIEITEQNKNIINTQKAHDAFKDTCSDYGFIATSNGSCDMSLWYCMSVALMKDEGISVPSFSPNDTNNTSFLATIDQIKDFAKNIPSSYNLPDNFLDFCDSFKDKLIQYGCK
jgi:hypothetical protein